MDFSMTDEQVALRELASRIFADRSSHDRIGELEASGEAVDTVLWRELAGAGLLGLGVPEAAGGAGGGLLEVALVLEQAGATVARVPYLETVVLGAGALARFGTDEQRAALLDPALRGELILTAALETGGDGPEGTSTVSAVREGGDWVLAGTVALVPFGSQARCVLLPVSVGDRHEVLLLDPSTLAVRDQPSVSARPHAALVCDGVRVPVADTLDGQGTDVTGWLAERALVGLVALQLGVIDRALRMSAEYSTERKQFDRPIGTFQAVAHRLADAYIDVEAVRLTLLQAVWRLDAGLEAATEIAVAKWWAAEAGHRVLHAAQHVHGGVGVDLDYPLHRFYRMAKELEFALGPAPAHLRRVGRALAAEPA